MRLILFLFACSAVAGVAHAGDPKEDFVSAVVAQCKKSRADAEKLATPGRTGTVAQFQLCSSPNVTVSDDCKLTCSKGSSSIGD